jgi:hypothetical protein
MTLTVTQCFDLPAREDITALGFVVRLSETEDREADARLVRDYVLTPTVASELPTILSSMRHTFATRGDLGRFVHGSFGSGKSHFLSFLGLLLENQGFAWSKDDERLRALGTTHRSWLGDAKLLVVRLHMLTTAGGPGASLDRAVYEATNIALARHGKAPFEFLHVDGVLREAQREAELYGAAFWKQLEQAGKVGSREDFEALASGSQEDREALARTYLDWKGRDPATAGVDPNFAAGLQGLAAHVKAQGFGGLVLLIDEFLLWLREKSGPEFEAAINRLNSIVDHADGARPIPVYAFVARQRNIQEFFPDMVEEQHLHEHLGHHAKRFEVTNLEDVELRHVCKGRVLKRRPENEAEVQRVVDALARDHEKLLPAILHGADIGYLRDVYPFHPALIEALIDVSSLMQRDRTALRLLYELLVLHNPTLKLGELLPVGSAFEAIFPEAGVEGSKRVEDLRAIHRTYYQRFRPAMEAMLRATDGDFDEARRHVLDMIVKTSLLAEVSPRLKGTASMTVERLVRLNDAEVTGETDRSKFNKVHQDLLSLSRFVPGTLQLSGQGREAVVSIVLQGVNFGELLDRARSRVAGQKNRLLTAFYGVLLPALGLTRAELGEAKEIEWRKTGRKGSIDVKNIRELPNADFKVRPGEEFRLLIDYPWDDPGHSVAEDEQRALDMKRRDGSQLTVCWLPRHLTGAEMALLQDLAAIDELLGPAQEELLRELAPHERAQVAEQAQNQAQNLRQSLHAKLGEVYRDHGRLVPLMSNIESKVPDGELGELIKKLACTLMDRAYSAHPNFGAVPKAEGLRVLCDWLARAAERPEQMEAYTDDEVKVLRTLGEPLELVTLGQTRGQLRLDTRYIKTVREEAKGESALWDGIDRKLQETYALNPLVRNFFLKLILRLDSFRAVQAVNGSPIEVEIDARPRTSVKLVRAPLLDLAEWSRARELGPAVLQAERPSSTRTLTEQDRYAATLKKAATEKRGELVALHEQLARLGAGGEGRAATVTAAIARLAPFARTGTDSCALLKEWMGLWPDDEGDPARAVVREAGPLAKAVERVDATARHSLEHAKGSALATEVVAHLETLHDALTKQDAAAALAQAIERWNIAARQLLQRVVSGRVEDFIARPDNQGSVISRPPEPTPTAGAIPTPGSIQRSLRASDASARQALHAAIDEALRTQGDTDVHVTVTIASRGR